MHDTYYVYLWERLKAHSQMTNEINWVGLDWIGLNSKIQKKIIDIKWKCLPWPNVRCTDERATLNKITFHIFDSVEISSFPLFSFFSAFSAVCVFTQCSFYCSSYMIFFIFSFFFFFWCCCAERITLFVSSSSSLYLYVIFIYLLS